MATVRITREFPFEMAHALWNYDGPCRNIHGHSYRLFVTISGSPLDDPGSNRNGMLMDFSDLKAIVRTTVIDIFDHALVVYKGSPDHFMKNVEQMFEKFHKLDYQPTCENLITDMATRIRPKLPAGVNLHSLKLYETATSFAEWFASDNL
ncbi:MAG: 6-carboxytetrahydropterin synthase [Bacteroidales bacterium]